MYGNLIGVTAAGNAVLGPTVLKTGIYIGAAGDGNEIGGIAVIGSSPAGLRNVISGCQFRQIRIDAVTWTANANVA